MTEAQEQSLLFKWAAYRPELALMFAIPNGGTRDKIEAAHLKKQGVKRGVPDLFLPVAHGAYYGLFIEMKREGGRVSPEQKEWIARLNENGYRAVVCFGFEKAREEIEAYLRGEHGL